MVGHGKSVVTFSHKIEPSGKAVCLLSFIGQVGESFYILIAKGVIFIQIRCGVFSDEPNI